MRRWNVVLPWLACMILLTALTATVTAAVVDRPASTPTTVDARKVVAESEKRLAAEIDRLNAEIVKQGTDQLDLRRTVTTIERASRSAHPTARATSRVGAPVRVASSGPGCGWAVPAVLDRIARCESHCNPLAHNRRSSAAGAFQTLTSTWGGYGGYPTADAAPLSVQIEHAQALYARSGTRPWNASRSCWS